MDIFKKLDHNDDTNIDFADLELAKGADKEKIKMILKNCDKNGDS